MKWFILLVVLLAPGLVHAQVANTNALTTEILVPVDTGANTPGRVPAAPLPGRRALEIQNLGPNPIYCSIGKVGAAAAPVVNKSREVPAKASGNNSWALDIGSNLEVRCIAATASQVTGAATVTSEVR